LDSLNKQTFKDFQAIVFDSLKIKAGKSQDEPVKDDSSSEYLRDNYPQIEIISSLKNTGFARSHNHLIDRAISLGAKYYLAVNVDMTFEFDFLEKLVNSLDRDNELAAVCPKILKWDFSENKKTSVIDTLGIGLKSGLMFYDVGQGKTDNGLKGQEIIGPSGACGLYRLSALKAVAEAGKYFDEKMFMYKEDCDLAYRLFITGAKAKCVFEAVAFHDRTTVAVSSGFLGILKSRKGKSQAVKRWSFLNQQIIFAKYWKKQTVASKIRIIFWQIGAFGHSLLFEPYLLRQYFEFFLIRRSIKRY
jgi:GT2 family glycosyltransferase